MRYNSVNILFVKGNIKMGETRGDISIRNQHLEYIDVLRVLSMLSVVFLHTAAGSLRGNLNSTVWHLSNLLTAIMSSSVPIFFMISGAMLLNSEKTLSISFTYKKRLPKAVIPFLVWSLVAVSYFAAIGFITSDVVNWKDVISKLKNITSQPTTVHLWFMYALIPLYILSPILKRMVDALSDKLMHYLILLWVIFSSVIPTIAAIVPVKIQSFFVLNTSYNLNFLNGYLGYFIIGYFLLKYEKPVSKKVLMSIILIDTIVISFGTWLKTSQVGQYSELFKGYSRVFILIISISIFLLVKEMSKSHVISPRYSGFVRVLSSASFGIYLFHNLLINLISKKVDLWPAKSLLSLFGCFFAVFFLSLACIIVAASLKPTCYAFTGLTFKNACETMNIQYFVNKLFGKKSIVTALKADI